MNEKGPVSERKTWITGVGLVSPLGNSYQEFSERILEGVSSIRPLTEDDGPTLEGQIAACIETIPTCAEMESAWRPRSRVEHLTLSCCIAALRDAGWWERRSEVRVGIVMGMGGEWHRVWEESCLDGERRLYDPSLDTQSVLDFVRQSLSLTGPVAVVAAACASGNHAIATGRRWIDLGWADVCLAGGCDLVTPITTAGFSNLRALSRRTSEPAAASRPFDCERDGFVMGEGGAVLVLESADRARRRGARAYAEVAGFGASSDATHMIIPSNDPEPAARAIRAALRDALLVVLEGVPDFDVENFGGFTDDQYVTLVATYVENCVLEHILSEVGASWDRAATPFEQIAREASLRDAIRAAVGEHLQPAVQAGITTMNRDGLVAAQRAVVQAVLRNWEAEPALQVEGVRFQRQRGGAWRGRSRRRAHTKTQL